MNEKELMIGDWVTIPALNTNAQVTAIGERRDNRCLITLHNDGFTFHSIEVSTLRPIPIVDSVLLNNGFAATNRKGDSVTYVYSDNSNTLAVTRISAVYMWGTLSLMNVHQLQHILNLYNYTIEL